MAEWLVDLSANGHKQAYLQGFLDISGSDLTGNALTVRHGNFNVSDDVNVSGNIDVTGSTLSTGNITSAYDTNSTSTFGRTKVGYMGYDDWAGISHIDKASTGSMAFMQKSDGTTYLNAANGQYLYVMQNNRTSFEIRSNSWMYTNQRFGSYTGAHYPLHVNGAVGIHIGYVRFFYHNYGGLGWGDFRGDAVGIYSHKAIGTDEAIFAHSDRRIKKDISEINDDSSLQKVRLLKPSYYKYRDHILRGERRRVEGFIAQDVEEVIPSAVRKHTERIPNIMLMGTCVDDNNGNKIITIPEYNTADLEVDASGNIFTKLFVYTAEPQEYVPAPAINDEDKANFENDITALKIIEVLSPTEIRVETSNELTEELFIYGQEVDNKCFLAKDKIFTVGISALQEVDRQLQAEKEKTTAIETKISLLETQRNDVLTRLSVLENSN